MKNPLKLLGILALSSIAMHTQAAAGGAAQVAELTAAVVAHGGVVVSSRDVLGANMDDLVARGGIINILDDVPDSDAIVAALQERGGGLIVGSYGAGGLLSTAPESEEATNILINDLLDRARAGDPTVDIIRGRDITVPSLMLTADRPFVGGLCDIVTSIDKPVVIMENTVRIPGVLGLEPGAIPDGSNGGGLVGRIEIESDFPILIWGNKVVSTVGEAPPFRMKVLAGYSAVAFGDKYVYVKNTTPVKASLYFPLVGDMVSNGNGQVYIMNNAFGPADGYVDNLDLPAAAGAGAAAPVA